MPALPHHLNAISTVLSMSSSRLSRGSKLDVFENVIQGDIEDVVYVLKTTRSELSNVITIYKYKKYKNKLIKIW